MEHPLTASRRLRAPGIGVSRGPRWLTSLPVLDTCTRWWRPQGSEGHPPGCSSEVVFVSTQNLFPCKIRKWDLSTWGKTEESSDRVNGLPSPAFPLTGPFPWPPLLLPSSLPLLLPARPASCTHTQDKLQRRLAHVLEILCLWYRRSQDGRIRQAKQSREPVSQEVPRGGVGGDVGAARPLFFTGRSVAGSTCSNTDSGLCRACRLPARPQDEADGEPLVQGADLLCVACWAHSELGQRSL